MPRSLRLVARCSAAAISSTLLIAACTEQEEPASAPVTLPTPEPVEHPPSVSNAGPDLGREPIPTSTSADVPPDNAMPDDRTSRGIVAEGESLSRILARHGLDATTIHRITTALGEHMDVSTIAVGHAWVLERDELDNPSAFEYAVSPVRKIRAELGRDDEVTAKAIEIESTIRLEAVAGEIETSLWEAVTDTGETGALVMMIAELFASGVDFYTDTRTGDRFTVLVEKKILPDGSFLDYGRVLAATYRGEVGRFEGAWWEASDGSARGYFDRDGNSLDHTLLKSPLKFTRISSGFNPRRMHPVLHRVKGHNGTDYAAPEGTPVWAAADGVIAFRAKKGGAGNMVILSHEGGMKTLYMHLSRFEDGQRVGQKVAQRTVIGYVGQTGLATGPHLHFSVQLRGRYVDPQEVKSIAKPGVPRRHLSRFRADTRDAFARLAELAQAPGSGDAGKEGPAPQQAHKGSEEKHDPERQAAVQQP